MFGAKSLDELLTIGPILAGSPKVKSAFAFAPPNPTAITTLTNAIFHL